MNPLAAVLLLLFAQTQTQPPPQEVPPHDITKVDKVTPGTAISVPLPEAQRKKLEKYEIPELVGARQALGSQLRDGELPKPLLDYISKSGGIVQRLSLFEGGLAVINVTGAGATIRKKLIIPDDALKQYLKSTNATALAKVDAFHLVPPQQGREAKLRAYTKNGQPIERSFDPMAVLPKEMSDQILPLEDLLRAMSEDRGITNSVAGYVPVVGDQLVADDNKVYRISRIMQGHIVELKSLTDPTTMYVESKDLYNYFIGTTGEKKQ